MALLACLEQVSTRPPPTSDKFEIYFGQRNHRNIPPRLLPQTVEDGLDEKSFPHVAEQVKGVYNAPFWRRQRAIPLKAIMHREAGAFPLQTENMV